MAAGPSLACLLLFISLCPPVKLQCAGNCTNSQVSLLVVILSQRHFSLTAGGDDRIAQWRAELNQVTSLQPSSIVASYDLFTDEESKAIVPIVPKLYSQYGSYDWFLLVDADTKIHFDHLASLLINYQDPQKTPYFLGHGIYDDDPKITHHFLPNDLLYPLECSGLVLSNKVMKRISANWKSFSPSFTIDPFYEFTLFLKYLRYPSLDELHPVPPPKHRHGVLMTHVQQFCDHHGNQCVTQCLRSKSSCSPAVQSKDVFIAIKTCQKYHKKRIPIQHTTWTTPSQGHRIQYYSDVTDNNYNTVNVGVANTERGHCTKLLKIFSLVLREGGAFKWVVVADDDTLMSVSRLLSFLGCHDYTVPMIISEMYGYRLTQGGYLYPTSGAGVVLSKAALQLIVSSNITCPSHDSPDDMFLGTLARRLRISMLHSSLFHQNQPETYHVKQLARQTPISFHRFTPENPLEVYSRYLLDHMTASHLRTEL